MNTSDAVVRSAGVDATPLPTQVGEQALPRATLSPPDLLGWIAAAGGDPWFPSRHASDTGTDRDALDVPLNELRLAGLIRIETWMKGVGQGYVLTPEGERAHKLGHGIPMRGKELPSDSYPALGDVPPPSSLPLDFRPAVAVPALLIANVLWFFATLVVAMRAGVGFWQFMAAGDPAALHRLGALAGTDLLRGEWWRLLTCCFVHAGAIHLVGNLFSLAIIGPLAELLWGRRGFAVIYFLACLGGSCLAMAISPQLGVVGASGGVCGMLLAVGVWFWNYRADLAPDEAGDVARRLAVSILAIVGLSLLPGISWEAHLGGAVAGLLAAAFLAATTTGGDRRWRRAAQVVLLALPIVMVAGLLGCSDVGRNWLALRARLAEERTHRTVVATTATFDREVVPLLTGLSREAVAGVQRAAVFQLALRKARRDPRVSEQLTALKAEAERAAERVGALSPVGLEVIDQRLARAKAFAEARARSFTLLLDLLAQDRPPTSAQMDAWLEARLQADALDEAMRNR